MSLKFEPDNTTLRQPRTVGESAWSDVPHHAWDSGAVAVPRDYLLNIARAKVSRLLALRAGWNGGRALPIAPLSALMINGMLDDLVRDGGATPQVAPLTDGGIEVEWLVFGDSLRIEVSSDGRAVVEGYNRDGASLVDGEVEPFGTDHYLMDQAREWLNKLSERVVHRAASAV